MRISETKREGGWCEIGIRNTENKLIAVITHPCSGAAWFVHKMEGWGKTKFKTKKAALASVMEGRE